VTKKIAQKAKLPYKSSKKCLGTGQRGELRPHFYWEEDSDPTCSKILYPPLDRTSVTDLSQTASV